MTVPFGTTLGVQCNTRKNRTSSPVLRSGVFSKFLQYMAETCCFVSSSLPPLCETRREYCPNQIEPSDFASVSGQWVYTPGHTQVRARLQKKWFNSNGATVMLRDLLEHGTLRPQRLRTMVVKSRDMEDKEKKQNKTQETGG